MGQQFLFVAVTNHFYAVKKCTTSQVPAFILMEIHDMNKRKLIWQALNDYTNWMQRGMSLTLPHKKSLEFTKEPEDANVKGRN